MLYLQGLIDRKTLCTEEYQALYQEKKIKYGNCG